MAKATLDELIKKEQTESINNKTETREQKIDIGEDYIQSRDLIEPENPGNILEKEVREYTQLLGENIYKELKRLCNSNGNSKGIGIFGRRNGDFNEYCVDVYFLSRDSATYLGHRNFKKGTRAENYKAFRKFVEDLTGAPPLSYDYDSNRVMGKFALALDEMIGKHIDRS